MVYSDLEKRRERNSNVLIFKNVLSKITSIYVLYKFLGHNKINGV